MCPSNREKENFIFRNSVAQDRHGIGETVYILAPLTLLTTFDKDKARAKLLAHLRTQLQNV